MTPPQPHAQHPTVTLNLPSPGTDFVLNIQTKSLMGSRAKLADVPKLHELITHQVSEVVHSYATKIVHVPQIRRVLLEKGTWKIVLPGLASVSEVKEDVKREQQAGELPVN